MWRKTYKNVNCYKKEQLLKDHIKLQLKSFTRCLREFFINCKLSLAKEHNSNMNVSYISDFIKRKCTSYVSLDKKNRLR